jgi:Acyclic terpene utilisation family protein AtuA
MKTIRIGGGLGYWGDRNDALMDLLRGGPLDYVIMDYLAEITMSILQKQRLKDPRMGYAHDFVPLVKTALPLLRQNRVRLIADAGGLNPLGLADALVAMTREAGFPEVKVGVVYGDDLMPHLETLTRMGIDLRHFDTGVSQQEIPGQILSANAYFGAFPIAEALDRGADIVVTGRVNDAALALGPMIHEFGWEPTQYELLGKGTMAGHLLECGGQASGGNFNGGWQDVPDLANLGFPIGEVGEDGSLTITLHPGQGGLITPAVLKEQLLYEIGDPAAYIVADVISDITQAEMEDLGNNRVRVRGVRGHAPTSTYKVSMSYEGRYQISVGLVYTWPDCVGKARASADLVFRRLAKLGIRYHDHLVSIFGYDGVHGDMSRKVEDPDEVYLRMAFLVDDVQSAEKISREMITHILCGIPTSCGLEVGRPTPHKQIVYWPSLIPKTAIRPCVTLKGGAE